jgi:Acetyltransferase (GNAT) domain
MPHSPLTTCFLASVAAIDRAQWDRLYGTYAEGYDFHVACHASPPDSLKFSAAAVLDGDRLVAGVPLLHAEFRLDMPLQGRFPKVSDWLDRHLHRYVCLPVLAAGSPYTDELGLGLDPALDVTGRQHALEKLVADMLARARAAGTTADLIAFKDVTAAQAVWADPVLRRFGFSRVATLPVAILSLPFKNEAEYIASLSQNQRSNLRRKLKKAKGVRVEVRRSIVGLEQQIAELREATRQQAGADYGDFEQVAPEYFANVMRHMPGNARVLLYWLDHELIGFALVFLEPRRMIFQYVGLRYPAAREHGIYFLNWMTMVRLCLEMGIGELRAGQTTYVTKCRLGCTLERTWIYFRHRVPGYNLVCKVLKPLFAIDRIDPDLRMLGGQAPYGKPRPGAQVASPSAHQAAGEREQVMSR